ncbi:helix-turn-helix transcriptional regulator [Nonomuraea endophytica]|uniref:Putative DNA-binding transcriptional regulator YafY n=1 Tax=Nonomuraea endophytica TaxID=714136 RepID=A0A7W8AEJ1_9ACTN|nr:WYL domain-containing protein [Nonomuraea endophytica]MBB5083720.1 putative DNA-binding transcriptional regulator YafY [Nonomuraea endophytica]
MAETSRRALRLLSLLATARRWSLSELASRLDVSERTVRRDIETLRALDYPVTTVHGPAGGYSLGAGHALPPLLLDDEQALAITVALQTAPSSVFGLGEDAERALDALKRIMPARLRTAMESLNLTSLQNYWEFPADPIGSERLRAAGIAVRHRNVLIVDMVRADGTRPAPGEDDFSPARRIEPHHLVIWAGRWYLVAYDLADDDWRVRRLDRLHLHSPTGIPIQPRDLPGGDVARFVMTSHDRGDTPATWPCTGTARLNLPAETVARWAPGGSMVEHLGPDHCRLTIGAWSWAGVAGILATFDADMDQVTPTELVDACRRLVRRWHAVAAGPGSARP